jgi:hypothetical protein
MLTSVRGHVHMTSDHAPRSFKNRSKRNPQESSPNLDRRFGQLFGGRSPFASSFERHLSSQCADDREMMVIVVCDKLHEVDKPQFPLEARMHRRTRYDRIVSIR